MSSAWKMGLRMVLLFGAIGTVLSPDSGSAGQKINFSSPSNPVSDPRAKDIRNDAKPEPLITFGTSPRRDITPLPPQSTPSPRANRNTDKTKDLLFPDKENKEPDDFESLTSFAKDKFLSSLKDNKNSPPFDRGWSSSAEKDPWQGVTRSRNDRDSRESRSDYTRSNDADPDRRNPTNDRDRSRLLGKLGESFTSQLTTSARLGAEQQEKMAARNEFAALFRMPTSTTPVGGSSDLTNSIHDSIWKQSNERTSSSMFSSGDPNTRGSTEEVFKSLASPSRSSRNNDFNVNNQFGTVLSNQRPLTDSGVPDAQARQPAILPFPKRPGSLLK